MSARADVLHECAFIVLDLWKMGARGAKVAKMFCPCANGLTMPFYGILRKKCPNFCPRAKAFIHAGSGGAGGKSGKKIQLVFTPVFIYCISSLYSMCICIKKIKSKYRVIKKCPFCPPAPANGFAMRVKAGGIFFSGLPPAVNEKSHQHAWLSHLLTLAKGGIFGGIFCPNFCPHPEKG